MGDTSCPWFVTPSAAQDYADLRRIDRETALVELMRVCEDTWATYERQPDKQPKPKDSGALEYRAPRSHRYVRLVVSHAKRIEGDKPQLIAVRR